MRRLVISFCLTALVGSAALVSRAEEKAAPPKPPAKTPEQLEAEKARRLEVQNKQWNALSVEERDRVLRLHLELQQLPKDELKIIRDRINRYQRMTAAERQQLETNHERWAKMKPAEREQARRAYLRLRWEYEVKWRKEHPGQEPPPFKLSKPQTAVAAAPPAATNQPAPPAYGDQP